MAAVNFPNPAATNPDTNAPYRDGWYNPDNGVTYIYVDAENAWKAATVNNANFDDIYVNEVGGDHMQGPLTIGPDTDAVNSTITLAADGSATFAGTLDVDSTFTVNGAGADNSDEGEFKVFPTGSSRIKRTSSTPSTAPALRISNNTDENAVLYADGSAKFAGNIFSGDNTPDAVTGDRSYGALTSYGLAAFYRDGADETHKGFGALKINASGQTIGGEDYGGGGTGNYFSLIQLNKDGTSNWSVKTDGSATFSGGVGFNDGLRVYNNARTSRFESSTVGIGLEIKGTDNAHKALRILNATGNEKILLNPGGSATFAGDINSGDYAGGDGIYLDKAGSVRVRGDNKNTTQGALLVYRNGSASADITARINQNGSAHFKGNVTSDGTIGFNLEPDNPDNYTSTTVEGEEQLVYNGPTLDVKERLTKADTALQTLKTAAAAAVDFAELKAAIATALADI